MFLVASGRAVYIGEAVEHASQLQQAAPLGQASFSVLSAAVPTCRKHACGWPDLHCDPGRFRKMSDWVSQVNCMKDHQEAQAGPSSPQDETS